MKLKAWDNHEKRWAKTHEIEGELFINPESGDTGVFYIHDHSASGKLHYTVVKSTGLKDRHGKEIWEGDKLKSSNGLVFVVTWNQERFGFQIKAKDKHGIEYEKGFQSQVESDLEVIGNIYEGGE